MNTSPTLPTHLITAFALASAIVLTACGPETGAVIELPTLTPTVQQPASEAPQVQQKPARSLMVNVDSNRIRLVADTGMRGRVKSIEPMFALRKPSGVGAVAGGVIGGVLGNQIGGGSGRTAATVVGAVGGAVVGNQVEKHQKSDVTGYHVKVQMDNGEVRGFDESRLNGLKVGDRVRANGTHLRRI